MENSKSHQRGPWGEGWDMPDYFSVRFSIRILPKTKILNQLDKKITQKENVADKASFEKSSILLAK